MCHHDLLVWNILEPGNNEVLTKVNLPGAPCPHGFTWSFLWSWDVQLEFLYMAFGIIRLSDFLSAGKVKWRLLK